MRLRVHDHLEEWFAGYCRYRRGEKGEINEADDHLMRATGLMLVHGLGWASPRTVPRRKRKLSIR